MTIETEATPRPWMADDEAYIRTPEGRLIAVVHDGLRNIDTNDPIARANAALIVRAVNSLDALVALRNEVAALTPFENAIREAIGNTNYTCLMHRLKAALASGEGE